MDQIIDIATDGRHLSRDRGFLKVSEDGREIGRTPLGQVAGVIVHAHGTTWSTSLLVELAERGAPVVLCGPNHAPRSVLMPLEGHHAQGGRLRAQWQARAPLMETGLEEDRRRQGHHAGCRSRSGRPAVRAAADDDPQDHFRGWHECRSPGGPLLLAAHDGRPRFAAMQRPRISTHCSTTATRCCAQQPPVRSSPRDFTPRSGCITPTG